MSVMKNLQEWILKKELERLQKENEELRRQIEYMMISKDALIDENEELKKKIEGGVDIPSKVKWDDYSSQIEYLNAQLDRRNKEELEKITEEEIIQIKAVIAESLKDKIPEEIQKNLDETWIMDLVGNIEGILGNKIRNSVNIEKYEKLLNQFNRLKKERRQKDISADEIAQEMTYNLKKICDIMCDLAQCAQCLPTDMKNLTVLQNKKDIVPYRELLKLMVDSLTDILNSFKENMPGGSVMLPKQMQKIVKLYMLKQNQTLINLENTYDKRVKDNKIKYEKELKEALKEVQTRIIKEFEHKINNLITTYMNIIIEDNFDKQMEKVMESTPKIDAKKSIKYTPNTNDNKLIVTMNNDSIQQIIENILDDKEIKKRVESFPPYIKATETDNYYIINVPTIPKNEDTTQETRHINKDIIKKIRYLITKENTKTIYYIFNNQDDYREYEEKINRVFRGDTQKPHIEFFNIKNEDDIMNLMDDINRN